PIYDSRLSERGKSKGEDKACGERAVDADRHEAAAALLGGGGNRDGTGGAAACRHAAILRYADTDTRMIRPAGPHHVASASLRGGRKRRHYGSIRPEVLKDGKEHLAKSGVAARGMARRPGPLEIVAAEPAR